ncbi:MAG: hypothetical protein L3J71_06950 [Victivallaceae bacterium]|nr:hypothetical protein [Victivallaceae bacterium]
MNRSILIVICDFIVLSVLSLNSSIMMPADGKFSGGLMLLDERTASQLIVRLTTRNAELEMRQQELEASRVNSPNAEAINQQLQQVNRQLQKTRAQLEVVKKTAKNKGLPSGELGDRLEKEIKEHAAVKAKLLSASENLHFFRNKFKTTSRQLNKTQKKLQITEQNSEQQAKRLNTTEQQLAAAKQQLGSTSTSLEKTRDRLTSTQSTLGAKEHDLQQAGNKITTLETISKENRITLSYTKGKLNATKEELNTTKTNLDKTRNNLFSANVELINARKQLNSMKTLLNKAVSELSTKDSELKTRQIELAQTKEKLSSSHHQLEATKSNLTQTINTLKTTKSTLQQTNSRLQTVEGKLTSDALKKYSQSAIKLSFAISEDRLFMPDYKDSAHWFTPLVSINGKTWLVSYFNSVTGINNISGHSRITKLDYSISKAADKKNIAQKLNGPILVLKTDPRASLIEVPALTKPMKALSFSELKARGVDDLYLFKSSTFGKKSGKLDGRCSLNLEPGKQYLYIRNSTRSTDAILKAEPGDFVISKQGEFIGIVVAVEISNFGKKAEAKCFILPDKVNLDQTIKLPLQRGSGEKYYDLFAAEVDKIKLKVRRLK